MARTSCKTIVSGIEEVRARYHGPVTEDQMIFLYKDVTSGPVVKLNGRGFADQRLEHFCNWFSTYRGRASEYREMDFSDNELTAQGVALLINTLRDCCVWVERLRLHRNKIESGKDLAGLIHQQQGVLKELHLSHNRLSTSEGLRIVMAALDAKDRSGALCYPHSNRKIPLWLRLEGNLMKEEDFLRQLESEVNKRGKSITRAICYIDGPGAECRNSFCMVPPPAVPQVHLTYVHNQVSSGSAARESGRTAPSVKALVAKAVSTMIDKHDALAPRPKAPAKPAKAKAASSSGSAWKVPDSASKDSSDAKPCTPGPEAGLPEASSNFPSLQWPTLKADCKCLISFPALEAVEQNRSGEAPEITAECASSPLQREPTSSLDLSLLPMRPMRRKGQKKVVDTMGGA